MFTALSALTSGTRFVSTSVRVIECAGCEPWTYRRLCDEDYA
jgi:hypothetical protein